MIVSDIVEHYGTEASDRLAVVCRSKRLSYGELRKRSRKLANALAAQGIGAGQRVGVLSTNSAEYVEVVFALSAVGSVWVPINFRLAPPEVLFILRDCDASALLYSPDLEQIVSRIRDDLEESETVLLSLDGAADSSYENLIAAGSSSPMGPRSQSDDAFAIMYTSGTTGNPKGVLLTHRQFLTGTYYFAMAVQASPDDRKLQAIPQFHAGGAIYQMAYMLVGATIVVLPLFDPETAVQLMKDEKVTVAGFVPAMLNGLCAHIGNIPAHVPNLRKIMYGGSSIPTSLLLRAMELFPVDFIQTYGQTEAAVIVTILDAISHRRAAKDDSLHLLRSCGRPILGYEVRLMTRDGPQTEAGELCVRSDALMSRYWKRPEATAATLVDGWLHTGDVATRDEDGLLYIVDRKVDMIVSGGENVYALEVENILSGHPDLAEVAVIGVPDPQWGELVLAVAVARDGRTATSDQVREFCRGRIGGFKIPKRIEYIDSLPRNASGKVLKHVLRKQFTGAKPY